jgi:predicted nucleic acid-binding Zn ribbon protein
MVKVENTSRKTVEKRLVENPKTTASGNKCCKYCDKPIQYFTDDRQVYCSNTCRSLANQAQKVAKMELADLKKETAAIAKRLPNGNEAVNAAQNLSNDQLWKLVEAMMTELATEKSKNVTLSKELGKFKKVAFNLYVSE